MPPENSVQLQESHESAGISRIKLPFTTVVTIAINGLKIRFWRSMVTASGIMLGIAFLSFVSTNLVATPAASVDQRARLIWLVVMSLLVSTVGIANSMLMSVTERFREIGTMKCLGAPDNFVVTLFFVEAVMVGLVASFIGWMVGFIASLLQLSAALGIVHACQRIGGTHTLELMVGCVIIGAMITLIATIAPAQRAAIMPAAAALRTEV